MEIRKALQHEYPMVLEFYYHLIDDMQEKTYRPGWKKEIYPDRTYLENAVNAGEMYIGVVNGTIAAGMILNHRFEEEYRDCNWSMQLDEEQIMIIHTLAVGAAYQGKGYAREMIQKAIELAGQEGTKAMRLDVLKGNLPAERLYAGIGFQYVETVRMYYEDTGEADFHVFEYILN